MYKNERKRQQNEANISESSPIKTESEHSKNIKHKKIVKPKANLQQGKKF